MDEHGPRYSRVSGLFMSFGTDVQSVAIRTTFAVGPTSLAVTPEVINRLAGVVPGTPITLYSYVPNSMSDALTPYSCVEVGQPL